MTSQIGERPDFDGEDLCEGPVALLLGAGASVDAGLPTSRQLVIEVRSHLENQMRSSFDAAGGAPDSDDTIEAVFSRLAERYGSTSPLALAVLNLVKTILLRTDAQRASYLSDLIHYGSPTKLCAYQPIFTLNYDTLFEDVCRRSLARHWDAEWHNAGFPRNEFVQERVLTGLQDLGDGYGAIAIPPHYRGDVEATIEFMRRNTILSWASSPTVHIHKLHGSLDWFRTYHADGRSTYPRSPIADASEPLDTVEYVTLAKKHSEFVESSRNVVALRSQAHQLAFKSSGIRYVSCMVFAGASKLTTSYPFFYLQSRFEKIVRSVWLLVVLGYSFGDGYLNQLVRARARGDFNPHFIAGDDHRRSKTVIVAPQAWNRSATGMTTIDGADAQSRTTAAIYCNATAREFASRYRQLLEAWWLDHVSNQMPWSRLSDADRFLSF